MPNHCQVIPNGPCPNNRCDSSVQFTAYDMFLCPQCIRTLEKQQTAPINEATSSSAAPAKRSSKNESTGMAEGTISRLTRHHEATPELLANQPPTNAISVAVTRGAEDMDDQDDTCPRCLLLTSDIKRHIRCDICQQIYHQKCIEIPVKVFNKFIANIDITGWVCDECTTTAKSSYRRHEAAMAHIVEELAVVKNELAKVRAQRHTEQASLTCNIGLTPAEDADNLTTMIVQRTLAESARRKRNVIISGLPEAGNERADFLRLCKDSLSVKPMVTENSCTRIGKRLPNETRLLLVRLSSDDAAAAFVHAPPS